MLCKDDTFWQFAELNGEEAARGYLCERLGISSRSEIKDNHDAQERLEELVQQFRKWRYGG